MAVKLLHPGVLELTRLDVDLLRSLGDVVNLVPMLRSPPRKVGIRLPGKGNSNTYGARPVY